VLPRHRQEQIATIVGLVTLVLTASGVFGEMQSALNVIWKANPTGTTFSRLIRAGAVSLGSVALLGFVLLVSLAVSAALTAFGNQINAILPFSKLILSTINLVLSVVLISVLFAAIYKILPDRPLAWRDVILGAVVTAVLFTAGKFLIAMYTRRSRGQHGYTQRHRRRRHHPLARALCAVAFRRGDGGRLADGSARGGIRSYTFVPKPS
jgi:membrane protein